MTNLEGVKRVKGKFENVDGKPGDEEERADKDQHDICSFFPCNLSCFTDGGEVSVRAWGRDGVADLGVEETDDDARKHELDQDTGESVGEVVVVRIPILPKKCWITNYCVYDDQTSKQKETYCPPWIWITFSFVRTYRGEDIIDEMIRMISDMRKAWMMKLMIKMMP